MIKCPSCGHSNIEGVDQCEQCQADLFELGSPESKASGLAQRLMEDSIMELQPQMGVTVSPEAKMSEVVRAMIDNQCGSVLVTFQGKLAGIFTERDFLMKVADRYATLANEPIRKFMTADPDSMEVNDSIALGLNKMAVKQYRHVPILQDGRPIATVRVRDILGYLVRHCPAVAKVR